jgi:hypothetical protein
MYVHTDQAYATLTDEGKERKAKGSTKVWLALFICFHSRAIHIELIES